MGMRIFQRLGTSSVDQIPDFDSPVIRYADQVFAVGMKDDISYPTIVSRLWKGITKLKIVPMKTRGGEKAMIRG